REHDRLDVARPLAQVGEVRQHEVDPELVGRGEHEPGVDHDDPVVVLDDRHVLADLPEPAEWQDAQGAAQTALRSPWRSSTPRISRSSSSEASTIGSRRPPTCTPSMLSAAFTGVGLAVMNIASKTSFSDWWISWRAS